MNGLNLSVATLHHRDNFEILEPILCPASMKVLPLKITQCLTQFLGLRVLDPLSLRAARSGLMTLVFDDP